jgi:phosphatidylglycerol lysyltransferase
VHGSKLPGAPGDAKPVTAPRDDDRACALVLAHGWNAVAFQILNPGISHWFSARGDAVVGYVTQAGTRVVAGGPVCSEARLSDVVCEFGADAAAHELHVCYFGAGARLEQLLMASGGWSAAMLGAQPSWDPRSWPAIVARQASLRAQLNRARNKGVSVAERGVPDRELEAALRRCLDEWLAGRGLPPLHFLVEPETLSRLQERRLFVATRAGAVVAFLLATPVPARSGWLVEQIVRGRAAPNGTAELLLDAAMRAVAEGGAQYLTLGLAPLSRHSKFDVARMPLWLRLVLRLVRAHGRRFYDFEGLDRFKAKFRPEQWEEIVAIADAPRFPPRALWAIAAAFAQGSPALLIGRALVRAVRQEGRWARRALRGAARRTS